MFKLLVKFEDSQMEIWKRFVSGRHVDNYVLTKINGRQVCAMEECEMGNPREGKSANNYPKPLGIR